MSNITAVNNSSDAKIQSASEIMMQVFQDLRENHPTRFEDSDLSGLKSHRRYKSLPNLPKRFVSAADEAVQINLPSSTALTIQNTFFNDLRENHPIAIDSNDYMSLKPQRRYKSMTNMTLQTNATVHDASDDEIPSVQSSEIEDFTDSSCEETTINSAAVLTPVSITGIIDIDTTLSVSPTCPPIEPVESTDDAKRFVSIQLNMAPRLIGDDVELKNSLTNLLDPETTSLQEIQVFRGGHGDATEINVTVTAADLVDDQCGAG